VGGLLIVVPVADWAFTIAAGLKAGRLVLPAVASLVIGSAALTVIVDAGVGALVAESPAIPPSRAERCHIPRLACVIGDRNRIELHVSRP
jgi:hypothetical protein